MAVGEVLVSLGAREVDESRGSRVSLFEVVVFVLERYGCVGSTSHLFDRLTLHILLFPGVAFW